MSIPVAMSSEESKYITAVVACMQASHLMMLSYNFDFRGTKYHVPENIEYDHWIMIIDNNAAIPMASCNKVMAGNRHYETQYHCVRQGTNLKEHIFY